MTFLKTKYKVIKQIYSSTISAVHHIDEGEYTLGIFLDLIKGFDTVNHNIFTSDMSTTAIPQRSVLAILLFLFYIYDIQNCSNIIFFVLFADDTNAFYSNSCLNILKTTMQK